MMACSTHPEIDVNYRCEDHDTVICASCLAERHRKCNIVNEISGESSGNNERFELAQETLSQLQEYIVASENSYEENKESLRSQQSEVLSEQQQLFDDIYEELSQAKKKLELETDALVTKELNDLERNLQRYKQAELEEQDYKGLLDVTLKLGNAWMLNIIPDLILRKVKSLRETLETEYRNEQAFLNFNRNMDLKSLTNVGQVSVKCPKQVKQPDLGEYCLSSDEILDSGNAKPVRQNPTPLCTSTKYLDGIPQQIEHTNLSEENGGQRTSDTVNVSTPLKLMKCNVTQNGIPYCVRCPADAYPCNIYAIVMLPDERLVLTDLNNMKFKVLEQDFSLAYTFGLKEAPTDMCHVQDQEIAIAFPGIKAIKIYQLGRYYASFSKTISTEFEIVALAKFGNDKKLAVLLSDNEVVSEGTFFVQIVDTENRWFVESFHFEKSTGVMFVFDGTWCNKMLCRGSNEIFLSGYWTIHCFEKDTSRFSILSDFSYMQESWFYRNRKGQFLQNVTDLAADEEGNIYACGSESNNIHQISADDFRESRIIVKSIKKPTVISVNSKKGYLVVWCEEDDFMHVYNFS